MLLLTWIVYVYRDIMPLATTTMKPADADEGVLLWVKLAILTEAGVLVPLFTPLGKVEKETVCTAPVIEYLRI